MIREVMLVIAVGSVFAAYGCRGGSGTKEATVTTLATQSASAQASIEGGVTRANVTTTPAPGMKSATAGATDTIAATSFAGATDTAQSESSPIAATLTSTPEGVATPHPVETILPPEGTGVASGLGAEAMCSNAQPPKPIAELRWTPAAPRGSSQRVDVTIFSFDGPKYDSSEILSPDATSLVWDRVSGRAIHSWRVLTLKPEGWVSSDVAMFTGVTCGPF